MYFILTSRKQNYDNINENEYYNKIVTSTVYNDDKLSNDVEIILDSQMSVDINITKDIIGLTKCLEDAQSFHMFTGSKIIIPKGVTIRQKDSRYNFVTMDEIECTYQP